MFFVNYSNLGVIPGLMTYMCREITSMASEVINSLWDKLKCGPGRPGAMSSSFQSLNTPPPSCFYSTEIFCIVNCLHLVMIAPTRSSDLCKYFKYCIYSCLPFPLSRVKRADRYLEELCS